MSSYLPPKFCAFVQRAWTVGSVVVEQPSAVLRLSGIRSGLVTSIADSPAGGGTTAGGGERLVEVLSPPGAEFGGGTKPNCTFTGRTTGVTMLPTLSVPLAASPATHAA